MRLYIHLQAPYDWAVVDSKDQVLDSGRVEDLENFRPSAKVEQIIGVAPGDQVTMRATVVPGKRRSNVEAALPYALEESLSENVEELHFALLDWQPGEAARAAIVSKQQLKSWIEQFRLHGIMLDFIVPEYLLLPQHPNGSLTVALLADSKLCVREDTFNGYSLEPDLFEMWWNGLDNKKEQGIASNNLGLARNLIAQGGENVSHWEIGNTFAEWLGNTESIAEPETVSLLTGEFVPAHRRQNHSTLKAAAVIALAAILGFWGYSFYEYKQLKSAERQVDRNIVTLFLTTFPNETYLDRPRKQVEGLINRARGGGGSESDFKLFMEAVRQVTPSMGATIDEVGYRDQSLVVLCTVSDLSTLDRIREAFEKLDGISAELLSSGARDNKISGRFRLRRA